MPNQTTITPNGSSPARTIAVIGARGRLGRLVTQAFAESGWHVIAITRDGKPVENAASRQNVQYRDADALEPASLSQACQGCGFVFNALNPPYTRWHDQALPLIDNVLKVAAENGAIHLFPGNVYNFGSAIPENLYEDTRQSGDHPKAAIRIEMERRCQQAARQGKARTIILRAGDYFGGTGTGSWFDQVIAAKTPKGRFTYPGPRDIVHAWAYLPDLAQAFVSLAENADRLGAFETFHFEGHSVTGEELKRATELALARPLKAAKLPWFVLRIGGLVVPMWREVNQIAYLWQRPHRLSGRKLAGVIGEEPHTPLEVAVAAALRDLGIVSQSNPAAAAGVMPTLAA